MKQAVFEDEMTEEHLARTEAEYRRVTDQEIHEERVAVAQAFARSAAALLPYVKREMGR